MIPGVKYEWYVFAYNAQNFEVGSTTTYYFTIYSPYNTITVNTSPYGLDNPQGGGTYNQSTRITISIGNVSGHSFKKWQRDGVDYSTQQSFSYQVDVSHTFTAVFAAVNASFSILFSATFSVSGLGSSAHGDVLVVDNTNYEVSQLPLSFLWLVGSSHVFSWVDEVWGSSVTYWWQSTSGEGHSGEFGTVSRSSSSNISISAVYVPQYLVTLEPNP